MGVCLKIVHKIKHILYRHFLETENCKWGSSYIWVNMTLKAYLSWVLPWRIVDSLACVYCTFYCCSQKLAIGIPLINCRISQFGIWRAPTDLNIIFSSNFPFSRKDHGLCAWVCVCVWIWKCSNSWSYNSLSKIQIQVMPLETSQK
jgi:hypothetical protein